MINFEYNYEQALLYSKLEIQEEAIRTIDQEIHDNIGQVLSLAKLQLNAMPQELINNSTAESIAITKDLLGKAIADLRSLSKKLQPGIENEFSLEISLNEKLKLLKETQNYHTSLIIENSAYKIPAPVQILLFSIVQDVINCITKHSSASTIDVTMNYHSLYFSLLVVANDIVPSKEASNYNIQQRLGLKSMRNRLTAIGATLCLEEPPGGGIVAKITLPAT